VDYRREGASDTVLKILWMVLLLETSSPGETTRRMVFRAITQALDTIDPEDNEIAPIKIMVGEQKAVVVWLQPKDFGLSAYIGGETYQERVVVVRWQRRCMDQRGGPRF
jgi:hypothetical protein